MPDTIFAVIAQGLVNVADAAKLSASIVEEAAEDVEGAMGRIDRASNQSEATRAASSGITGRGGPGETRSQGPSLAAVALTPESLVNAINRAREIAK